MLHYGCCWFGQPACGWLHNSLNQWLVTYKVLNVFEQYQAIIFDMDGTLVDSGKAHETAWIKTLEQFEIPVDRPLMRSLAGVPTLATLEHLVAHFDLSLSVSLAEAARFKESALAQLGPGLIRPTDLYHVAKQYYGVLPLAVGTGASTKEAEELLALCGLKNWMECIVGADQVTRPKPAPDTFLRCAELLGVLPGHCVVLEDSKLGIEAAKSAGMAALDVLEVFGVDNPYFL